MTKYTYTEPEELSSKRPQSFEIEAENDDEAWERVDSEGYQSGGRLQKDVPRPSVNSALDRKTREQFLAL